MMTGNFVGNQVGLHPLFDTNEVKSRSSIAPSQRNDSPISSRQSLDIQMINPALNSHPSVEDLIVLDPLSSRHDGRHYAGLGSKGESPSFSIEALLYSSNSRSSELSSNLPAVQLHSPEFHCVSPLRESSSNCSEAFIGQDECFNSIFLPGQEEMAVTPHDGSFPRASSWSSSRTNFSPRQTHEICSTSKSPLMFNNYDRSSHAAVVAAGNYSARSPSAQFLNQKPMKQKVGNFGGGTKRIPSLDGFIYHVRFKRAHRNFVLSPAAPRSICVGDFVKVEADRGEDLGVVMGKTPEDQFEEIIPTAGYRGRGFSSGPGERKMILRMASHEEQLMIGAKVMDEELALQDIREKVFSRGLPMTILDAEYQFDRHKLTFYFEADRRIDFRDMVSELFSHYKTRIWMQQVDTSSLDPDDPGVKIAVAAGLLPFDREDYCQSKLPFLQDLQLEDCSEVNWISDSYLPARESVDFPVHHSCLSTIESKAALHYCPGSYSFRGDQSLNHRQQH